VPGQAQVAGVGPVTVEHGWHLALAAAAARSALAELGASLGGDLDLGHGAVSSSQRAMRVRSVADNASGRGSIDPHPPGSLWRCRVQPTRHDLTRAAFPRA